ncbi:VOC family protein [Silvibacterium dinghuense]|uniref:Glyoxalase n=1 Tax=Silvibacterium dinghuense TaxID=1560006 RepID=A0A4V1NVY5_9BACT|nr:VOC family protein [Silvibacterium dinghuense]RXS97542.1 glyoxalase [Silvibacterium dinghuense]GGG99873.1 hypothetical protein GCM10011586_14320 [Silvibacterium dinghuense]
MRSPVLLPALFLSVLCSAPLASAQDAARPAITGISHIAVYAANPAMAEHFYGHDIGLEKRPDPEDPSGARYYVNATQFVEVLPLPASSGNSRLDHLAYTVTDAEAMRAYLAAHAVHVPTSVEKASDGSRWFDVKDPEGNMVQFVQSPSSPARTAGDPIGRHIIHVGMLVRSREAENSFYRGVLGFRPYWFGGMKPGTVDWISQQVPDGHDWLEYMLTSGPSGGGIQDVSQKQLGVLNHLSIGVVNMEKAVTALDAGNRIEGEHSPMQLGKDGKWQFNLYDPDGTRLELMEYVPVEKPCCSPFTAPNPPVPAE